MPPNYHLFNVRVLLKATFVYALLIAFALELYQLAVQALTRLLPLGDPSQRHVAAATLALILHAVTSSPCVGGWSVWQIGSSTCRTLDTILHTKSGTRPGRYKAEDLPAGKGRRAL